MQFFTTAAALISTTLALLQDVSVNAVFTHATIDLAAGPLPLSYMDSLSFHSPGANNVTIVQMEPGSCTPLDLGIKADNPIGNNQVFLHTFTTAGRFDFATLEGCAQGTKMSVVVTGQPAAAAQVSSQEQQLLLAYKQWQDSTVAAKAEKSAALGRSSVVGGLVVALIAMMF